MAQDRVNECERLVRLGQMDQAAAILSSIKKTSLARNSYAQVANLHRRLGLYKNGLHLLRPLVRPEHGLRPQASEEEACVYAALLIKVGAASEAEGILDGLRRVPERLLYMAFAQLSRWKYEQAIAPLEAFIKHPEATPYQRAIAIVNLASAYASIERLDQATEVTNQALAVTKENDWRLLNASAHEIHARLSMQAGLFDLAEEHLAQAQAQISGDSNVMLFTKKWRTLIPLIRSKFGAEALDAVRDLRDEAERLGHWETLRDCDLYRASATADVQLFARVYFGTPYPAYRAGLKRKIPQGLVLPDGFHWGPEHASHILDVASGRIEKPQEAKLKSGQKLHRLLVALTRDFYRPALVGAIAAELFPEEYFDPEHSTKKISELVMRLRTWCCDQNLSLTIEATGGGYRLSPGETSALRLSETGAATDASRISELLTAVGDRDFSAAEASACLGLSVRTINGILKEGVSDGRIESFGRAKATRYRRVFERKVG